MLSPGTMVGPYQVLEHVGAEGTMAEVYRAVGADGRTVAVKLLGELRPQARLEASAVASFWHPAIVRTFDVLELNGRLCLIQEWIDGQSLETVLNREGRLSFAETVRMGRDVAAALTYAHQRNILHRDLKPSNVLRTADGDYKLVDFGAAGLLDPGTELTQAGEIAGTPLYMSPEQAVGTPQSPASDVYGLGLLLYRSLYGHVPFEDSDDFISLLANRLQKPVVVPLSPLKGLLERCLARDPAQRPQSAQKVFAELSALGMVAPAQPVTAPGAAFPQQQVGDPGGGMDFWPDVGEPDSGMFPRPDGAAVPYARIGGTLLAVVVVLAVVLVAWLLAPDVADAGFWLRVGAGVVIVGVALVVARRVRRLSSRAPDTERQAASILTGAGGREALTRSMVLEVDQVVAKLKGLDAKFLGLTMMMLIREAEEAKESADRVAALVQLVTLMETLMKKLSPWYVRHKEAIATVIAIVGSLVGVASVVSGFLR